MTTQPQETDSSILTSMTSESPSQNLAPTLSKKDATRIISWVNTNYEKAKNDRWKTERQWYLNLAFYYGRQNVQFKGDARGKGIELIVPPAPHWRARPVVNKIKPRARKEMAKLTSQKPNAFIIPASSDERDLYAAQAGEQIWRSIFHHKKTQEKIRRQVFWAVITGNGFLKSFWNPNALDQLTGMPGDIDFLPVMPMRFFVPDLMEEDLENQPYIFEATRRSIDSLQNQYQMKFTEDNSKLSEYESSFTTLMGVDNNSLKETTVIECWIKPGTTTFLPSGGLVTVANDHILWFSNEGIPYEHGLYPYSHMGNIPTGKFFRESMITDLIPLQREYNRTRGQIIESKNRMASPQLAAEQGSIDATKVTNEPGQIIFYRPGFQAPTPIQLQPIPSYVLQEQDRIQSDMDEISGQHEISRGQTPSGVTAATAISYLQEQDDTQLSFAYDSLEESIEKTAKLTLSYVKQYWTEPRMVKVTGADGTFDVKAFTGSELGDNTDIRIEGGSSLPTSRAAKQAFIMELMKMNFIPPEKGLEILEIGGIDRIYEEIQIDVRQAQRENLKMERATEELIQQHAEEELVRWAEQNPDAMVMEDGQGNYWDMSPAVAGIDPETGEAIDSGYPPEPVELPLIVPVNSWDNHAIHIAEHNKYRKSQSFEQLPEAAKKLFEDHVNTHIMQMQTALTDQVSLPAITSQMEMPMPMGPGGPADMLMEPPVEGSEEIPEEEMPPPEAQGNEGM